MGGAHHMAFGGDLTSWWLREWQTLLGGASSMSSPTQGRGQLTIRPDDDHVTLVLTAPGGGEIILDRCPLSEWSRERLSLAMEKAAPRLRGAGAIAILSCPQAVTGSLFVPQRARPQAGDIIQDHLRRKMPVPLDDLVLGYEVRSAASGKLELVYLAVPKRQIDRVLARLSLVASDVGALQGLAGPDRHPVIVPYGIRPDGPTARWMRRARGLIVMAALLVPVGGFGVQAWRQDAILSDLETQATSLTQQARTSTDRLTSVYTLAGDLERLAKIEAAPGVVAVWNELARILPDTSYLTAFEIRGNEVHAEGLSASTADLILRLETSQHLHTASLTGPVVFDLERGKERFTFRALIRKRRFPTEEGG